MLSLAVLLLMVFGFLSGSAFLYILVQRMSVSKRVESGDEGPLVHLLREEVEAMSGRLDRMEDELEFYKQLKAPDDVSAPHKLPGPENPGS